ncbi:heme/steroid binding protein [Aspergillus neoniger CBS 115656]|uniref:Heme/steroid binding protein n=1 Tax=Aspergillus neoniger (strain CBS 115656) TaxID=1448310 RepID=A0A318YR47_ASPNB|nr:heme/steroid binding protein [Aspergillus neoniger CBS 115656]PYH36889.1 heme/steroid binding protein [Aspergillus neoniger CBS 115656]
MGWVGVATLIATACFLLYRYPPGTWAPEPPASEPLPKPVNPPAARATEKTPVNGEAKPPNDEDDAASDTQTTPKAVPSSAPAVEVPSFRLDDSADQSRPSVPQIQTSAQTQTTMKPPSQPLTQTKMADSTLMPPPPPPQQSNPAKSSSLMPPPAPPRLRPIASQTTSAPSLAPGRYPPRPNNTTSSSSLRPPPSAAASLRAPPSSGLSSSTLAPTKVTKPSSSSKRAVLEPGYSPLDWAALTSNPNNKLRGENLPPTLIRVTPSMLKAQNGRKGMDAWTSYQGKVYNITPYLPFHPGGRGELLRGAGKDSGRLFFDIHPWVNWDAILGECLVGILVSENDESDNKLDAMD